MSEVLRAAGYKGNTELKTLLSLHGGYIVPPINSGRWSLRVQGDQQVGPGQAKGFRRPLNKHQTRSTHLLQVLPRGRWLRQASQPAAGGHS